MSQAKHQKMLDLVSSNFTKETILYLAVGLTDEGTLGIFYKQCISDDGAIGVPLMQVDNNGDVLNEAMEAANQTSKPITILKFNQCEIISIIESPSLFGTIN